MEIKKSKLIMVVVSIIIAGALFGVMGYLLGSKNSNVVTKSQDQLTKNQNMDHEIEIEEEKNNNEEKDERENIKDEMDDWKTYKNEKSGYEISYPSDWIIISDWKFGTDVADIGTKFCGPEYKSRVECSAGGKGNNPVITLREYMPDYKKEGYCTLNKESIFCKEDLILSQKNIKIAGRDGIITEFKDMNYGSMYANCKKNSADEKTFSFSVVGLKKYFNYREIFNQMLSTLKFTE